MQLEEINKLSNKELRIKVAELNGFKPVERAITGTYMENVDGVECIIPDYPNDLNACHEFEKDRDDNWQMRYYDALRKAMYGAADGGRDPIYHATAEQRCKAFVLTMSK